MAKQKTVNDVRGVKMKCVNYSGCPMCYGCRSYNSSDPECKLCVQDNAKKNICNTNLHKSVLINRLITKNVISFTDNVEFRSNK